MVRRSEHLLDSGACPPATGQACVVCCDPGDAEKMLLCDSCDCGFHWYCVGANHRRVPRGTARAAARVAHYLHYPPVAARGPMALALRLVHNVHNDFIYFFILQFTTRS
jgi:hypothetical protein